jgi:hypothetical protein
MGVEQAKRLSAAGALGRFIGTQEGRSFLASNGYVSDIPIVVALPEDSIHEVVARAREHTPPVVIAVWSEQTGKLQFVQVDPGSPSDATGDEFSGQAAIGMLMDLFGGEGRDKLTFRITDFDWDRYVARSFPAAGLVSA